MSANQHILALQPHVEPKRRTCRLDSAGSEPLRRALCRSAAFSCAYPR